MVTAPPGPGHGAPPGAAPLTLDAVHGIPAYVRLRVTEILEAEQLARYLPEAETVRGRIEALIPADATLAEAHAVWRPEYLAELPGLEPFGAEPGEMPLPSGLVRVTVECVTGRGGGMGSFHGFTGWFVSLLVSIPRGSIWDSRVEAAT